MGYHTVCDRAPCGSHCFENFLPSRQTCCQKENLELPWPSFGSQKCISEFNQDYIQHSVKDLDEFQNSTNGKNITFVFHEFIIIDYLEIEINHNFTVIYIMIFCLEIQKIALSSIFFFFHSCWLLNIISPLFDY